GDGFSAAQLARTGLHHQRAAAQLGHPGREGDPGAGGGLVEEDRDGARPLEGAAGEAVLRELEGEGEDLLLLGGAEIVVAQEGAGHVSSLLRGPTRSRRRRADRAARRGRWPAPGR